MTEKQIMKTFSGSIAEPVVHRCPVCNGNGMVPAGFYNQTTGDWSGANLASEQCRSCDGKGCIVLRGEVTGGIARDVEW